MENQSYIPGVCNINKEEVAYRRKAMVLGFAVALIVFVGLVLLHINPIIRALITFLPLYVGVIGYFQVKNKFCVSYGASGRQNAAEGSTSATDVGDENNRQTDKSKARSMNIQAFFITLAILGASLFVSY